jgi:hypothetical protein
MPKDGNRCEVLILPCITQSYAYNISYKTSEISYIQVY